MCMQKPSLTVLRRFMMLSLSGLRRRRDMGSYVESGLARSHPKEPVEGRVAREDLQHPKEQLQRLSGMHAKLVKVRAFACYWLVSGPANRFISWPGP